MPVHLPDLQSIWSAHLLEKTGYVPIFQMSQAHLLALISGWGEKNLTTETTHFLNQFITSHNNVTVILTLLYMYTLDIKKKQT